MKKILNSIFPFRLFSVFFILIFLYSILHSELCSAQNLVPNPSFEQYTLCPDYQGQIIRLLNWYDPTQSSADFFSTCATNNMVAVPQNFVGTQNARTGNNYVGICTQYLTHTPDLYISEAVQVQLTQPLLNKTYYASFYVSLADSSEYCTKSIAASFSDTATHINNPWFLLDFPKHIFANQILNDTSNWKQIDGYYRAHGGEQYITLGYFRNDTTAIDSIWFQNIYAGGILDTGFYYYIDDVLVIDSALVGITEYSEQQTENQNFILNEQNNNIFCINDLVHESVLIEICDLFGKRIISKKFSVENINRCLTLDFLESGIYVYSIVTENIIKKKGFILNIKN